MHRFTIRVYYEDTDLAGIVYYANYLKFTERARSEWLRELGIDQVALKSRGVVFAARHVTADYLSPARYDDELTVTSALHKMTAARLVLDQNVLRDGAVLFTSRVTLVCVGPTGKPVRLPEVLTDRMAVAP